MGDLVTPNTFLIGYSGVDRSGLIDYLEYSKQTDFLESFDAAVADGLSPAEALCSFYAKLCYKSLVNDGRNVNITRVRDIRSNLEQAHDQGHGSIFEHVFLNFVITNCSRVFTHELVRHRIGTAFSQTSGRFCRLDSINLVFDPILDGCEDLATDLLSQIETTVYLMECKKGLRKPPADYQNADSHDCLSDSALGFQSERLYLKWVPDNDLSFDIRKKVTSAIRRIAPNGQDNEIGFSVNIRALRQLMQVRTSAGAEWEIRTVFNQIYDLVKDRFPMIFYKARTKIIDGQRVIYGMKTQPYEIAAHDPAALKFFTKEELIKAAE